ncbi:MAG: M17 family metallopeptidase [Mycoplasma sp.]|nr:M17 family metallopeptidase [Mycoplasma sp.]
MTKLNAKLKNGWRVFGAHSKDMPKGYTDYIEKHLSFTEYVDKKEILVYLDAKKWNELCLAPLSNKLANYKNQRDYMIDWETFITDKKSESEKPRRSVLFGYQMGFFRHELWTMKTEKEKKNIISIMTKKFSKEVQKGLNEAQAVNFTRDLQIMSPNKLNSETYAKLIEKEFKNDSNVTVKVLGRKEAEAQGMGLFLGVNAGSAYEPKIVVLKYKGNAKQKENLVVVGKGITFDAGGYNIKVGKNMGGMKYDMSGSAIAAGAIKLASINKAKTNLTSVLMLTDNMISGKAITPDAVLTASNGKTVEINNTDAEGRLALADGLVYATEKLKATKLIDVATLTGAVIVALGSTYTGTWATQDEDWNAFSDAAIEKHERVWRMPFHKDYFKFMSGSKVADFKNTDLSGKAGSSSAAMFLKQFTNELPYIHLDVAGTSDWENDSPQGVMVKTIVEYAEKQK